MSNSYPQNALVVVADGHKAKLFRNHCSDGGLDLRKMEDWEPEDLDSDGPAGNRPKESSQQDTNEAIFAKQIAVRLNRMAHKNTFDNLVLVADPQTLGQMRPSLNKKALSLLLKDFAKTLTNSSIDDIQRAIG